eukprot:gene37886-46023_t
MDEFMAITGLESEEEALEWLSAADFDVAVAVDLFLNSSASNAASHESNSSSNKRHVDHFDHQESSYYEREVRRPDPIKKQRLIDVTDRIFVSEPGPKKAVSAFSSGAGFNPKHPKEVTLKQLYQAPTEIMCPLNFEGARELAFSENKWLLVNIQDESEFNCHLLNRDFWKTSEVQDLVQSSFIFWQQLCISSQGKVFIERYKVQSFPYIAIIDPSTGAKRWHKEGREGKGGVDVTSLSSRLQDFLGDYPSPSDLRSSLSKGASAAHQQVVSLPPNPTNTLATSIAVFPPSVPKDAPPVMEKKSEGFRANEVLAADSLMTEEGSSEDAACGRKITCKLRAPWGKTYTLDMLTSQSVQHLLRKVAELVPTTDATRSFDITYGFPVCSLAAAIKSDIEATDATVESVGLNSNTALQLRFI